MMMALQYVEEYAMSSAVTKIEESTQSTIRHSLAKGQSTNPAIQRLRSRVLTESDASQVITSYDRMHHRHNRS
jgi:hypothetical protein